MELYTKIAFNRAIDQYPIITKLILKEETREEGIQLLSEKAKISVNWITLNIADILRKLVLTTI